jgi:hypothetical protein
MPVELQIIRACEFVRLGARGEFDFQSTWNILKTLADACRKRGIERAMLDVRGATSNLTPKDLAELVNAFGKAAASRRMRLAILHTGDQNYRSRLFAFFSAMRGRKARAVENFEEGLEWLSIEDDSDAKSGTAKQEVPIRLQTKIPVKEEPSDH